MIAKAKACCLDKEFDHEEEPFEKDIGEMYVSLTCVAVVAIVIIVVAKGSFNEYTCKIENFYPHLLSYPTFLYWGILMYMNTVGDNEMFIIELVTLLPLTAS